MRYLSWTLRHRRSLLDCVHMTKTQDTAVFCSVRKKCIFSPVALCRRWMWTRAGR